MKEGGVCYVMLCYVCYVEICLSITSGTRGVGVSFHFLIEKGKKKEKKEEKPPSGFKSSIHSIPILILLS